jgi:hypothetical protein
VKKSGIVYSSYHRLQRNKNAGRCARERTTTERVSVVKHISIRFQLDRAIDEDLMDDISPISKQGYAEARSKANWKNAAQEFSGLPALHPGSIDYCTDNSTGEFGFQICAQ